MMQAHLYAVAYDVTDHKRRLKVAQILQAFGERVQYSLFEVLLTPAELAQLQTRLLAQAAPEDALRILSQMLSGFMGTGSAVKH